MENSNSYHPIDLSTIVRKLKVNSDRDLEQEVVKACEILKDTCKSLKSQLS